MREHYYHCNVARLCWLCDPETMVRTVGKRKEERIAVLYPVKLWGMDSNGRPFIEASTTLNVSGNGALLKGVHVISHHPGLGMGIKFHNISRKNFEDLQKLIEGLPKPETVAKLRIDS